MIAVRSHASFESGAWADLVAACDGNPLHFPALSETDYPGLSPLFLTFEREGRPAACALAYAPSRRSWPLGPAKRSLELPTAPALGPRTGDAGGKREVLDALVAFARGERYENLVIRPRWGTTLSDLPAFAPHVLSPTLEFELDLSPGLDAVRASFHRFHRKNIRRAERNGLVIVSDPSVAGLGRLRGLQIDSSRRSAERGGGFRVGEESHFARLHELIYSTGLGDVLFAREGEATLAGLAYVTAAGKAITVRSGSTPEGYEKLAMYLLQDAVVRTAAERGLHRLNLGGVPEEAAGEGHVQHGLYEFKRGFGGAPCLRHGIRMPLHP